MAERIYHDQMNDPSNTEGKDVFRPQNENGTFMKKDEAMDRLHKEALMSEEQGKDRLTETQIAGRERIAKSKEMARNGVEACSKWFKGKVMPNIEKAGRWASRVGESVAGAPEYLSAQYKEKKEAHDKRVANVLETGGRIWNGALEGGRNLIATGRETIGRISEGIKEGQGKRKTNELLNFMDKVAMKADELRGTDRIFEGMEDITSSMFDLVERTNEAIYKRHPSLRPPEANLSSQTA